eukprot:gene8353-5851_t
MEPRRFRQKFFNPFTERRKLDGYHPIFMGFFRAMPLHRWSSGHIQKILGLAAAHPTLFGLPPQPTCVVNTLYFTPSSRGRVPAGLRAFGFERGCKSIVVPASCSGIPFDAVDVKAIEPLFRWNPGLEYAYLSHSCQGAAAQLAPVLARCPKLREVTLEGWSDAVGIHRVMMACKGVDVLDTFSLEDEPREWKNEVSVQALSTLTEMHPRLRAVKSHRPYLLDWQLATQFSRCRHNVALVVYVCDYVLLLYLLFLALLFIPAYGTYQLVRHVATGYLSDTYVLFWGVIGFAATVGGGVLLDYLMAPRFGRCWTRTQKSCGNSLILLTHAHKLFARDDYHPKMLYKLLFLYLRDLSNSSSLYISFATSVAVSVSTTETTLWLDTQDVGGEVADMAVNDNGAWVAVAAEDGVHTYMAAEQPGKAQGWRHVASVGSAADPVNSVAWAPSAFYNPGFVACTRSGTVSLWRFVEQLWRFEEVYSTKLGSPAWRVAWAPQEYGRLFAVGAADGSLTTFSGVEALWESHTFHRQPSGQHQSGCTSLSFAPFMPSSALLKAELHAHSPVSIAPLQLVSCDRGPSVVVWTQQPPAEEELGVDQAAPSPWSPATELPLSFEGAAAGAFPAAPTWREVAWAPNNGLPFHYVAAGSSEGFIGVWVFDEQAWRLVLADTSRSAAVTRLSWSEVGSFLLASYADGSVAMWQETPSGAWKLATELEAEASIFRYAPQGTQTHELVDAEVPTSNRPCLYNLNAEQFPTDNISFHLFPLVLLPFSSCVRFYFVLPTHTAVARFTTLLTMGIVLGTLCFALVGVVTAASTPLWSTQQKELCRVLCLVATACCWLSWILIYMAQMNPLLLPTRSLKKDRIFSAFPAHLPPSAMDIDSMKSNKNARSYQLTNDLEQSASCVSGCLLLRKNQKISSHSLYSVVVRLNRTSSHSTRILILFS